MGVDRRTFFARLGGAGAGVATLTALRAIAPEVEALELKNSKQYVFRTPHVLAVEEIEHMRRELLRAGLKNPLVICGDVEIFELTGV